MACIQAELALTDSHHTSLSFQLLLEGVGGISRKEGGSVVQLRRTDKAARSWGVWELDSIKTLPAVLLAFIGCLNQRFCVYSATDTKSCIFFHGFICKKLIGRLTWSTYC